MKVSLQGSMAAGKTTYAKLLENEVGDKFKVLYEYIKKQPPGLNPHIEQDYYEIQKYFINLENERFSHYSSEDVIFDLGPEEILFYTLNYPDSCGFHWNVEQNLEKELSMLKNCKIDLVIYLDANRDLLNYRKEHDLSRKRSFFEKYINQLHPIKKEWMIKNYDTAVIDINELSQQEVIRIIQNIIARKSDLV